MSTETPTQSTEIPGIIDSGSESWEDVAKFWAKKWMDLDTTATAEHIAQHERTITQSALLMRMHRHQENFLELLTVLEQSGTDNPFPALRHSLEQSLNLAHQLNED